MFSKVFFLTKVSKLLSSHRSKFSQHWSVSPQYINNSDIGSKYLQVWRTSDEKPCVRANLQKKISITGKAHGFLGDRLYASFKNPSFSRLIYFLWNLNFQSWNMTLCARGEYTCRDPIILPGWIQNNNNSALWQKLHPTVLEVIY